MATNMIDPSLLGPAGSGSPAPRPPLAGPSSTANPSTLGRPRVPPNGVAAPKPAPVLSEAEKAAEATRKTEEKTKKDKSLVEFMEMLDGYEPVIPEEVTSYYLQKAGFDSTDPRLTRLLSLTTQKFLSDIAKDSFHYARIRTNAQPQGRGRPTAVGVKDKTKTVLTMDDLSASMAERGVNLKKPEYFQ